jgi:hypothetical protein
MAPRRKCNHESLAVEDAASGFKPKLTMSAQLKGKGPMQIVENARDAGRQRTRPP